MLDERGGNSRVHPVPVQRQPAQGPDELENLGNYVSCIVVDEAHHSIAPSYSAVLRKMGFNWDNRKAEISEKGGILLGLTATPFRGGGDVETKRLHRWYNGVHFPTISYIESAEETKPHALIDCASAAYAGDTVRMLGAKSYDLDGFIVEHNWKVRSEDQEWSYSGASTYHKFKKPGRYDLGAERYRQQRRCGRGDRIHQHTGAGSGIAAKVQGEAEGSLRKADTARNIVRRIPQGGGIQAGHRSDHEGHRRHRDVRRVSGKNAQPNWI